MASDLYTVALQDAASGVAKRIAASFTRLQSICSGLATSLKKTGQASLAYAKSLLVAKPATDKLGDSADKSKKKVAGLSSVFGKFSVGQFGKELAGVTPQLGQFVPMLNNLKGPALAAGLGIAAMGAAVVGLGKRAVAIDKVKTALENATRSADGGKVAFTRVQKLARELDADVTTLGATFANDLKRGFSLEGASDFARMLAKLGPEAEGALEGVKDAFVGGVISDSVLENLEGAGVRTGDIIESMAKQLGKSQEDIRKNLKSGTKEWDLFAEELKKSVDKMEPRRIGLDEKLGKIQNMLLNTIVDPLADIVLDPGKVIDEFKEFFGLVFKDIGSWFTETASEWYDIGANLITGWIDGIYSKLKPAVDAIRNVGTSLITAAKDVFGIASPSKEFRSMGGDLGLGLSQGITDSTPGVTQAATKSSKNVVDGYAQGIQTEAPKVWSTFDNVLTPPSLTLSAPSLDAKQTGRDHADFLLTSAQDSTDLALQEQAMAMAPVSAGQVASAAQGAAASMAPARGRRGQSPTTVTMTNTFNIDGSKDPEATMDVISDHLQQAVADIFERFGEGAGAPY
jgi:hypothetical protein